MLPGLSPASFGLDCLQQKAEQEDRDELHYNQLVNVDLKL